MSPEARAEMLKEVRQLARPRRPFKHHLRGDPVGAKRGNQHARKQPKT